MQTWAVITGASSGIGREIALELSHKGFATLLVARTQVKLEELKAEIKSQGGEASILPLDLSIPGSSQEILHWCMQKNISPQVLVNNAGIGFYGPFLSNSMDRQAQCMQLNMNTIVSLTYQLLPLLTKNSKSYILNVGSTAAYQAIPHFSVYAATKSFVQSFSRALNHELSSLGVNICVLSPGPTRSNFMSASGGMEDFSKQMDFIFMDASKVARIGLKAMFKGKREVIPGVVNRLGVFLTWLMPRSLVEKIVQKFFAT